MNGLSQRFVGILLLWMFSTAVHAEQQASPRIDYAEQLILHSESAQRIQTLGNDASRQALAESKELYHQAREAQKRGELERAEMLGSDALRRYMAAVQLIPRVTSIDQQMRERCEKLAEEISSYLDWYDTSPYVSREEKQEVDQIKARMSEARELGEGGSYLEASRLLNQILVDVVSISNRSLTSRTVVSSLDFDNPADEYQYELARFNDYRRLVPLAIEQKQPTETRVNLMNRYVGKADELKLEADAAAGENVVLATQKLQQATEDLIRALGMIGVR